MHLTREQLLGLRPGTHEVEIPHLGGTVRVRTLTALERDRFILSIHHKGELDPTWRVRLAQLVLCNEDGSRMFGPNELETVGALSPEVVEAVANAALKHNRLLADDIKEAEGNSETTRNGVLHSA